MTQFEQLTEAFPLHVQRIAELCSSHWLHRVRQKEAWGAAGDTLRGAFAWSATSEGHDYWRALARGGGA